MTAKSHKKKLCKEKPACIMFNILNYSFGCIKECDSKGYRVKYSNF